MIARRTLREFWELHRDAEQPLRAWYAEVATAVWDTPQTVKERYRHASFVADNRVVFNIGGNKYRLIAHVNYGHGIVFVKFVGTHSEYDCIQPETV